MHTSIFPRVLTLIPAGLLLSGTALADIPTTHHVITAKAPVEATRYSGTVSILTASDIERSGASNLNDVLQDLPGIQFSNTGNISQQAPRIRGFSHEQTLILIDGKRIPNTDRNLSFAPAYRYNWVPVSQIERIEVIRGPGSSLYGADAMAGVINIITKKAGQTWQGSFSGDIGQIDGDHQNDRVSAALRGPLGERADLSLSISERNEEAIEDDQGATLSSDLRSRNLQADLGFDLSENDRLELGLLYGEDQGGDVDITQFMGQQYISDYRLDQTRHRLSADYLTRLGHFDLQAGISQARVDLTEGSSEWEIDEDNYQVDLSGALGEHQYLNLGLQHRQERAARKNMLFDEEVHATTLTLQDIVELTQEHRLTLGLAYDHHSKYDAELSPKIYWNWNNDSGWGLRAGYGQSYLAPSLREGSSDYIISAGPTRRYEGNDDLQPETNRTYEMGLSYRQSGFSGQLTLFHNRIDNLITTREYQEGPVTVARYSNVNEAITQGLEAEFEYQPDPTRRIRFNYTWLDSENRSGTYSGNTLADTPEHVFKLVVEQDISRLDSTLYGAWRYTDDQFTDAANSTTLDGFHVVDLGLNARLGQHTRLRLGINNLFDEVVESGGELIEPGRELKLSLSTGF